MTIAATSRPALKRSYPHADEVKDWPAAQTIKLLWERIFDLEERLQAVEGTSTTLVSSANTLTTSVQAALNTAKQALAVGQQAAVTAATSGSSSSTTPPGGGDGGDGDEGCAAAGPSGHDSGGLLNAIRAGQIVCGTGNEFAYLKNPTADLATRETQAEELLLRMIWHLREGGFTAGRQRNPSGVVSKDKLAVVVDGVLRAYDVFIDYDNYLVALSTHMGEVAPADMQDDSGWPDS